MSIALAELRRFGASSWSGLVVVVVVVRFLGGCGSVIFRAVDARVLMVGDLLY
jgi:hypothetical protein